MIRITEYGYFQHKPIIAHSNVNNMLFAMNCTMYGSFSYIIAVNINKLFNPFNKLKHLININ